MELLFFPIIFLSYLVLILFLYISFRWLGKIQHPQPRFKIHAVTLGILLIMTGVLIWKNLTPTWWYMADHPELVIPGVVDVNYKVAHYGWPIQFYAVEYGSVNAISNARLPSLHIDQATAILFLGLNILLWLSMLLIVGVACEWLVLTVKKAALPELLV